MKPPAITLTQRTIGGLLWMAWGKGAHAILQMLVLAVLARLLTPADFGVVSAALVVIGFSAIVSHLGLGPALVQRPHLEPRHVNTAFTASVLLGIVLGALLWLAAPLAAGALRMDRAEPVLRVLAWVFPLQGLGTVAESLMKRELRFRWLANLDVTAYAVGSGVVGISLALLGWGVWALVAAHVAHTIVKVAVLLASYPPRLRHAMDRRAFAELMYFGGGFTLARLANYLAVHGDNLVVARMLGPVALGFYGRAYQLMAAPAHGFGTVLDAVLFPAMARVQLDIERLAAAYRRGLALIALLVLPSSVALIIVAPEVIHVVLGPPWVAVVGPFQILAVGMLFRTSYKISDSLARSTGVVYHRAWRQALYAGLVVGGAWMGQRWGISGVACGVLAAVTTNFVLMADLSLRVTRMSWTDFWRAHAPAVRLTAALTPLVWTAAAAARHWSLAPAAVASAAILVVALGAATLTWLLPSFFLGRDGTWMLQAARTFAATLRPRASAVGSGAAVAHPATAREST